MPVAFLLLLLLLFSSFFSFLSLLLLFFKSRLFLSNFKTLPACLGAIVGRMKTSSVILSVLFPKENSYQDSEPEGSRCYYYIRYVT